MRVERRLDELERLDVGADVERDEVGGRAAHALVRRLPEMRAERRAPVASQATARPAAIAVSVGSGVRMRNGGAVPGLQRMEVGAVDAGLAAGEDGQLDKRRAPGVQKRQEGRCEGRQARFALELGPQGVPGVGGVQKLRAPDGGAERRELRAGDQELVVEGEGGGDAVAGVDGGGVADVGAEGAGAGALAGVDVVAREDGEEAAVAGGVLVGDGEILDDAEPWLR